MNNQMKILRKLSNKYETSFKYVKQKSHKMYLNDELLFSLDDKDIDILNSIKYPNRLNYERELLEKIVIPASEKYRGLDLDVYEKKCLFVLAFVHLFHYIKF